MKNVALVAMFTLGILITSYPAQAALYTDNFNDDYMNLSLWSFVDDGSAVTSLYEANGVLNFTSIGFSNESHKAYSSTWTYNLADDFWAKIDFTYTGTGIGESSIGLGIYTLDGETYSAFVDARCYNGNNKFVMRIDDATGYGIWEEKFSQSISTGIFELQYHSLSDTLQFAVYDINNIPVAAAEYANLSSLGNTWGIFAGGFSDESAVLIEGEAYLDNFESTRHVVPEPVTSSLFLFGCVSLALFKVRKIRMRRE